MNKKLIKCRFKLFLIVIPFIIFSCNNVKEEESLVLKSLKKTVEILYQNNNRLVFNGRTNNKSDSIDEKEHKFLRGLDELEFIRSSFYKDINEINIEHHEELQSLIHKYQSLLESYNNKYHLNDLIGQGFLFSNSKKEVCGISKDDSQLVKYTLMLEMEVIFSIYLNMIASWI